MKSYQDPDPLHGNGKAMPHPKRPTRHTYRSRGSSISIPRDTLSSVRQSWKVTKAAAGGKKFSLASLIGICMGLVHRASRGR